MVRSSLPPRPAQRVVTAPLELEDAAVPEDHHLVLSWSEALDQADYLALLDLPDSGDASDEQLRDAFHLFAERFHPDAYQGAPDDVREAATSVFRRGAEAYRVLRDPELRKRYLEQLAGGALRLTPEEIARAPRVKPTSAKEAAKTAAAANFGARADELLAAGDLKKARLQLQLATMKEPDNEDLAEMLGDVEDKLLPRRA
jgi:curved DNA-binding protein CbpA